MAAGFVGVRDAVLLLAGVVVVAIVLALQWRTLVQSVVASTKAGTRQTAI